MLREYHKWFSAPLEREMELLVFGHAGERALVFPTRQGRFFDYENWRLVEAAAPAILAGKLQLYCLDSFDSHSLYCSSIPPPERIRRHERYESYVLNEVLPFTANRNSDPRLLAHGCSIGAYHAVNLATRHPQLFTRVVALSGRYDLTRAIGPFLDLFSGYYDDNVYFHTPPHFLARLSDSALLAALRRLDITLAVGQDDAFCASTRELSAVLHNKQIPHLLDIWPGEAHRAADWREMVRRYLGA